VLFNKSYLNGMDLQKDLYQTCFDGEWTMDYMAQIIKGHSKDLNGDGQMTEVDQYGLLDNKNTGYAYMYGADQRVTVPDADGWPVLTLNTERMAEIVNRYYNLLHSGEAYLDIYSSASYATSTYRNTIVEGRAFLATLDVGGLYANLREIEYDFGLLPIPKFDEAQENYRTLVHDGGYLGAVNGNSANLDLVGATLEALNAETYRSVTPVYYETALKVKYTRDDTSAQMIDMIHDTLMTNFIYAYNYALSDIGLQYRKLITNKSKEYVSTIEKTLKSAEKKLETLSDVFAGN
jgi:hypothetical protein